MPRFASTNGWSSSASRSWLRKTSRASADVFASVTVVSTWDNATFAAAVCAQVVSDVTTFTITSSSSNPYFLLPDCFFGLPSTTNTITMSRIIIVGNSTVPDPLLRFANIDVHSLGLSDVIFINPNASDTFIPSRMPGISGYIPSWSKFSSQHTVMISLIITSSNIAGTLSPMVYFGSVNYMDLSNNALNGTFSSGFLTTHSGAISSLSLYLQNNWLSGTLPKVFGSTTSSSALGTVKIDLSSNAFAGTLPASVITTANFANLATVLFNVSNNLLYGSLPDSAFGSLPAVSSLTVDLSNNSFSGSVSSGFLTGVVATKLTTLSLSLNSNGLSGTFPSSAILTPLSTAASMNVLTLALQRNSFNGTLTDLLPSASTLSGGLQTFRIDGSYNQLSGSLPATLYSALPPSTTLNINFNNNAFNGTLPTALVSGVASTTRLTTLTLGLSNNQLSGSPFTSLLSFSSSHLITTINLDASNNEFAGTIPSNFCTNCFLAASGTFTLSLANNSITGTIPPSLLTNVFLQLASADLDLSANQLQGALPSTPMATMTSSTVTSYLSLNLAQNELSGAIPSSWFAGAVPSISTHVSLSLASNKLNGSLPQLFFSDVPDKIYSVYLDVANNPLSGSIAAAFFTPFTSASTNSSRRFKLFASNCGLTGNVPSTFLGTIADAQIVLDDNALTGVFPIEAALLQANYSYSVTLNLSARNNIFSSLALPTLTYTKTPTLDLDLFGNSLTQITVEEGASAYLRKLTVSNNPELTGSLPNSLFDTTSSLTYLSAGLTSLSGLFVDLGATVPSGLTHLNLSGTAIDFCSGTRTSYNSSAIVTCSLLDTNATGCQQNYPSECFDGTWTPPPVPTTLPIAPTAAPTAPISAPTGCSQSTRPSLDFTCVDGKWTTTVTVTTPTLVIPSGATETIIASDVESSSIVISGLGSTVLISGCANNLTVVTISLTPEQLKSLGSTKTQLLISYTNDTSCNDLSNVEVTLKVTSSSCRTAKVTRATSSSSLSGIFTVDSSKCKTWWIILVSVICAAVVIAVVVVALLAVFVPSVRYCLFPYRKRQEAQASNL